ncbi:hypothetical protein AJ80_00773 [Polytolypa hystricis UAMH7299]|uniref:Only prolin and serin are matching in the corresponding protein n=1 Tax=Polytolypa hystricis (strain UAMH7299) TaxID=1447883 RepID=A0A2B7Z399_POLH7|nr:hypothetical protein AJ80_00773 [Polytolypa hystricis UAMH7299]
MLRLSQLFESNRRDSPITNMGDSQFSHSSGTATQSPQSAVSSSPASPAVSLFSTRTHNRFPSSTSSLASSPGLGSFSETFPTMKTPLTGVKEEPLERETSLVQEDNYFPHFNEFHADDSLYYNAPSSLESHGYDLSDQVADIASSPKKPRSDSAPLRGISRISTRFTSMSSKWKQKHASDTVLALERHDESLRSRANSATSTLVSPTISSLSRRQSNHSPSPARTVFEERLSEAGIVPIDIEKVNQETSPEEPEPQARTPLLPPLLVALQKGGEEIPVQSPLQSPSVADVTDSKPINIPPVVSLPSPPLSAKPSMASISWQGAGAMCQTADIPPIIMPESHDEWSSKLGHANFTVQPEPYMPELCNVRTFEEYRTNWEHARFNYAKHLVRTGEHYGATSNIYKLTEEKWNSIDGEWRENHDSIRDNLEDDNGNPISLDKSIVEPGDAVKIPGLHDKLKFPDLGDEDIVGPMSVAPVYKPPTPPPGNPARKRTFIKFLQDLFCTSDGRD